MCKSYTSQITDLCAFGIRILYGLVVLSLLLKLDITIGVIKRNHRGFRVINHVNIGTSKLYGGGGGG